MATVAVSIAAYTTSRTGASAARATLTIPSAATGPLMPLELAAFRNELEQLADPTFFSGSNTGLIQAFNSLAPRGVLRLGGNTMSLLGGSRQQMQQSHGTR